MAQSEAIQLNTENIAEYLCRHTNLLNHHDRVDIKELYGGNSTLDEEGYVNFIYRVSQNGKSYIVKQARPYLRSQGIAEVLPAERNYLEYLTLILRSSINKQFIPDVYHVDTINNVFVMEDLYSIDMQLMRFQLSKGKRFPKFAEQISSFMACNHFYTSELFLEKEVFRDLQLKFANVNMRAIMEDVVLLRHPLDKEDSFLGHTASCIWDDADLRLELVKIRDLFIRKSECLIHGDLHTSNIFINEQQLRIIDMEYSFVAPFSYDLGYLLANFVSQYAAFTFNSHFTNEKRHVFQQYLLDTIRNVINGYFACFKNCFDKGAKKIYLETKGYLDSYLFPTILYEALGFMAAANMMRIINLSPFPDFDVLVDKKERLMAQGLSLSIDEYLLRNRSSITSPELLIAGILHTQKKYRKRYML